MKRSRVGKSRTVQGALMLRCISISPQARWNMRSEKGPCARVTWLWYSSAGLIARAGPLLAAHVPSILGADADAAQHQRALHGPRFPHPRALHHGTAAAALHHDRM